MMEHPIYRVKNWAFFQHYKDRRPPWIKLHHVLLEDCNFIRLPLASRALAPLFWLLASESEDGVVSGTPADVAFRLRLTTEEVSEGITGLCNGGYITTEQDASDVIAPRQQETRLETETETEREREGETEAKPARGRAAPSFVTPKELSDLPGWDDAWAGWVAYRNRHRAPVTDRVKRTVQMRLVSRAATAIWILDECMAAGWKDVRPDWLDKRGIFAGNPAQGSGETEKKERPRVQRPEILREFEASRTCPGHVPDMSRTIPESSGTIPESSGTIPESSGKG
jgi:hypothetical protein